VGRHGLLAGGESLFEPYLAMVQASPSGTAGSWNARWADLTLARQAAVIKARARPPTTNAGSAAARFEPLRN
jgi:hypothetical protein